MYYSNLKVFIINNVLFDLKNIEIYIINNEVLEIFDRLYTKQDIGSLEKSPYFKDVKETFFDNPLYLNNEQIITDSKITPNSQITNLQIKISNTCNLKCKYCYADQGNYGKKDCIMDKKTAQNLSVNIKKFFPNINKISFFGGEPLLNIDGIEIIVSELASQNILYSLITNSTILNNRIINLLNEYNIKVISSLDGPKEFNDINRISKLGTGTYNLISQNLNRLKKETNSLSMIEAVYSLPIYKQMSKYDLYNFFYENFPTQFIGIGDVITEDKNLMLPEEYTYKKFNGIDAEIDFTINKILNREFIPITPVFDIVSVFLSKKATSAFCGAGLRSLFIDELGNIYPCQLFCDNNQYCMGNIFDESEKFISDLRISRNNILENNHKDDIEKCKQCVANFWCFKCIGKDKVNKNFGACNNKDECEYYKNLTEKTLIRFSEIVNKNEFEHLMKACQSFNLY